jgi:hypothetical protein
VAGIDIDSMAKEIASIMAGYATDATADVKKETRKVVKDTVNELKSTSPEGYGSKRGHYKDGWTSKVEMNSPNSIGVRIYNKKKPGLTHLLEKGHAKTGGGRVEGIKHIEPAEQKAIKTYERNLKERLSR